MMTDAEKLDLATRFCAAWDRMDAEGVLGLLAPDCFFHNMPIAPIVGREAIRPVVEGFFAMAQSCHFDLSAMAIAPNGTVLCERVDRFRINGEQLDLPVMGAFEIEDGQIHVWRDYFDQRTLDALMDRAKVEGVI